MTKVFFFTFLFGFSLSTFIHENVIFQKVNEISTTRSDWLVTFVIDLLPFENFVKRLSTDIVQSSFLAQKVIQYYHKPGYETYLNAFSTLKQEYQLLAELHETVLGGLRDYQTLHTRDKRSVLPFVGRIMSFLFGTVSDEDLSTIKSNIRILSRNQKRISHVLEESLTIINVTRVEVAQNRRTINKLTIGLHEVDLKLKNISQELEKEITELSNFVELYVKLDLITSEVKVMIERARFYFEHLSSQLNMLSLGHLSPSTITPTAFRNLLFDIQAKLPAYLKLPKDPFKELWAFYQFLTCTTLLYDKQIFVIISVPLLDFNKRFEVFKVHSLPLPMQTNGTDHDMVAQFQLETEYLAVNAERSQYALLQQSEVNQCTNPLIQFCSVGSPIYPINLSNLCVTTLFMKKGRKLWVDCQTSVKPFSVLPMARYISSGSWLITTKKPLQFAVVCRASGIKKTTNVQVLPPLDVLKLNATCTANNDYMTLLPFYKKETKFEIEDPFSRLVKGYNFSDSSLWKPFRTSLPKFNMTKLPKELKNIESIPMDNLIYKLKQLEPIEADFDLPNWAYTMIYFSIAIVIGILIVLFCKYRHKVKCNCLAKRGSNRGIHIVATKYLGGDQVVSTKVEGDVSTPADAIRASAPLLEERSNNLYPVLNVSPSDKN